MSVVCCPLVIILWMLLFSVIGIDSSLMINEVLEDASFAFELFEEDCWLSCISTPSVFCEVEADDGEGVSELSFELEKPLANKGIANARVPADIKNSFFAKKLCAKSCCAECRTRGFIVRKEAPNILWLDRLSGTPFIAHSLHTATYYITHKFIQTQYNSMGYKIIHPQTMR